MDVQTFGPLDARVVGGSDGRGGGDGPVVVLLHGFGAPGTDLVPLARALVAPGAARFVFPEAPLSLGQTFGAPVEARAWWMIDMERYERAIVTGEVRDISHTVPDGLHEANARVNGFLDAVQARLGVTGHRVVLGGFSQGAMLSLDVALKSDRALAGLLLFSGTLLAAPEWLPRMKTRAGTRVVQSHGQMDPILPFFLAEELRDHLRDAGLEVDWVPFAGAHEIPLGALERANALLSEVL